MANGCSKTLCLPHLVVNAKNIRFPRHWKVLYPLFAIDSATGFIALRTMIDKSSSRLRLTQLKAELNKWRIAFLVFALSYAVLLVLNLSNVPMQWDEVGQLIGGLFLKLGLYDKFVGSAFYPPLFGSITMVFFNVFGVSLVSGRLVSVVFSVLSLWVVFEFAYSMYGGKVALISAVFLGIMPGNFWISRTGYIHV